MFALGSAVTASRITNQSWTVSPSRTAPIATTRPGAPAARAFGESRSSSSHHAENHSTPDEPSAIIDTMFRYAFVLAASAVADAPKAAVPLLAAAVDGARS
ncbi:hypothetical protein [Streptomyces sp. 3214.6]|uniref:hypothetical protein n=1 Tax=Streptomyces sp. 3214.6 TaxID=1882757 RepID=UPI0013520937|nr:hypothetical protein [Streptomyces sp. 3214.6]